LLYIVSINSQLIPNLYIDKKISLRAWIASSIYVGYWSPIILDRDSTRGACQKLHECLKGSWTTGNGSLAFGIEFEGDNLLFLFLFMFVWKNCIRLCCHRSVTRPPWWLCIIEANQTNLVALTRHHWGTPSCKLGAWSGLAQILFNGQSKGASWTQVRFVL
jgi:hypothetical protein